MIALPFVAVLLVLGWVAVGQVAAGVVGSRLGLGEPGFVEEVLHPAIIRSVPGILWMSQHPRGALMIAVTGAMLWPLWVAEMIRMANDE